jgi:hypothetical protein
MSSGKSQNSTVQQASNQPYLASGAAGSTSKTNQTFTPWDQVSGAYQQMANQTNQLAGGAPQYIQPSEQTLQGLQAMYGAIPGMQQAGNTALENYGFLSKAADVANNPYVQGMLGVNSQNVNQALTEQWLPALTGSAVASGSGAMGSSRAGLAQGQAVGNAAQQLANANTGMLNTAYGQGLSAQQNALSSLGALQQGMLSPAMAMQQAGQQMEGYQQNQINAPWQHLQNVGAALQYTNPLGNLQGTGQGFQVTDAGSRGEWDPLTMQRKPAEVINPNAPPAPTGQYGQSGYWPGGANPLLGGVYGPQGQQYNPYQDWRGYI